MVNLHKQPRLSAIQLCSVPDIDKNLAVIEEILSDLTNHYPNVTEHLVVLPETCLYFGGTDKEQLNIMEVFGNGTMQTKLANLAVKYGVYLLAGTIPLQAGCEEKSTASSLLFSPQGQVLNHYQKIHLFDVDVNDNEKSYRESKYVNAGSSVCCSKLNSINLGMTVCYDLRFPELFRSLANKGANVIAVPSAFTQVTGAAHWQTLLRARAIENQVYIVASNQQGIHQNGRKTYGHSMIINPWGEIETIIEQNSGFISTEFDLDFLEKIRADIPIAKHNKFSVIQNK